MKESLLTGSMTGATARGPIEEGVMLLRARDAPPGTLIENDGATRPRPSEPDAPDRPFSPAG